MQKGTTLFYHEHIQSNIAKLEERKDKFANNRINFLKEKPCLEIIQKINFIKQEIIRYKLMRDTQEEVIENEPGILEIKKEISGYLRTHQFYQSHVDSYEKKALQYADYNHALLNKIHHIKTAFISNQRTFQSQEHYLPQIHSLKPEKTKQKQLLRVESTLSNNYSMFPKLKHHTTDLYQSTINGLQNINSAVKIVSIGDKIQKNQRSHTHKINLDHSLEHSATIPEQKNQKSVQLHRDQSLGEHSIRHLMTQFDRFQTLFKECFDCKKLSIQKSVSQLQSKLIVNREEFLKICQTIGNKNNEKVQFELFKKLTNDQIMTLFISFVWLNKKLYSEFLEKRKKIMHLVGKLPKNHEQ